jgi:hypothetical protein
MTIMWYIEAAPILHRSVSSLKKDVMKGQVPHMKPFGPRGRVLFCKEDLEKFLADSRVEVKPFGSCKANGHAKKRDS